MPLVKPEIINLLGLPLPDSADDILRAMFDDVDQVLVKSAFSRSSGMSHVLNVSCIHNGYTSSFFVKIAPVERVKREWEAYLHCIPKDSPGITEIRGTPVYPSSSTLGGLCYPLIGNNEFKVETLYMYFRHSSAKSIVSDLLEDKLFASLRIIWRNSEVKANFDFLGSYGYLLPEYLLIVEVENLPHGTVIRQLNPETIVNQVYSVGDYVELTGFRVHSINLPSNEAILSLPHNRFAPYRIRWRSVESISPDQIEQIAPLPLIGVVDQTREAQLHSYVQRIWGQDFDSTARTIRLSNGVILPNPLNTVSKLLHRPSQARVACIHGDLNLENILVEHSFDELVTHLIDFGEARRDHVLHDPLHLEAQIATRLIPEVLVGENLPPEIMYFFYQQLHTASVSTAQFSLPQSLEGLFAVLLSIRKLAQPYLLDQGSWTEYYQGLLIYLLAALRYHTLDQPSIAPRPKQVAFIVAATCQALLNNMPDHKL
ncbi:MAG: phosphotransferase [Chloroflexi bacterium]|nr:phosphotransferase [Chloroflexota bacterium]MCI0649510.1 phosphotransferase [Chloroflexota bacterium]